MEQLTLGNVCFSAYDLGGHKEARQLWKEYFAQVDGIVYICDAACRERLLESKRVLSKLLLEEDLSSVPVLVLGNKIDLPNALSEGHLRDVLDLRNTTGQGTTQLPAGMRPLELFMCSIAQRQGYGNGFKWLAQFL